LAIADNIILNIVRRGT